MTKVSDLEMSKSIMSHDSTFNLVLADQQLSDPDKLLAFLEKQRLSLSDEKYADLQMKTDVLMINKSLRFDDII